MKTNQTTSDPNYNATRDISSPYADANYAFGRVKVSYIEYVAADDAFASNGPFVISSGYSAQLVAPSAITDGKASWEMLRGAGETATEATRNLLDKIDNVLRAMPALITETGN